MTITSRVQLIDLMRHLQLPLSVAELGVAEGIWSTELLSLGVDKLWLVDIWENVPFIPGCASFEQSWHNKNLEDVQSKFKDNPKVVMLKGFTYKMAEQIPDESLGMVYVDADHTKGGVAADIDHYLPKLVKGGIMAFHDYSNESGYGVYAAVQEFAQANGVEVFELPEDGNKQYLGAYFIKK